MLRDLLGVEALGGTMRLGKYPCDLGEGTLARRAYGEAQICERHRHRYEVNQEYLPMLRDAGLTFCGHVAGPEVRRDGRAARTTRGSSAASSTRSSRASRPQPHPLFKDFIRAARAHRHATREGVEKKAAELETPVLAPANLPAPNGQSA